MKSKLSRAPPESHPFKPKIHFWKVYVKLLFGGVHLFPLTTEEGQGINSD